jgi:hypothetical protein
VLATLVVAALGAPSGATNPAPTWLSVWLWGGIVPASLLLGPIWRALNPLRGITAVLRRATGDRTRPLPERLGYWPAAGGLGVFAWLTMVSPDAAQPGTVVGFLVGYGAFQVAAAVVYGPAWYARGEVFEVVSVLLGRLSPVGRRSDGRLVLRDPLAGAGRLHALPGQVAVLCTLLGTLAFDTLRGTRAWTDATGLDVLFPNATQWTLVGTAGLLGCVGVVAVTYLAAVSASLAPADPGSDSVLYDRFAACLLPVAAGYGAAHAWSVLAVEGRRGYVLASDPLGLGWDVFGTAGWTLGRLGDGGRAGAAWRDRARSRAGRRGAGARPCRGRRPRRRAAPRPVPAAAGHGRLGVRRHHAPAGRLTARAVRYGPFDQVAAPDTAGTRQWRPAPARRLVPAVREPRLVAGLFGSPLSLVMNLMLYRV